MPQDELFDGQQRWTGYQLQMVEVVATDQRRWDVHIRRRDEEGAWRTVWVGSWTGVMLDFANTLASDTITAFLFGERRDLARAAASIHRLARKHQASHDIA